MCSSSQRWLLLDRAMRCAQENKEDSTLAGAGLQKKIQ
jgi:hypothetical protein